MPAMFIAMLLRLDFWTGRAAHRPEAKTAALPKPEATDLGNGMPLERTMRTALMSVEVGRNLGLPDRDLSSAFYLALLKAIGCTAFAHEDAQAYGDDIAYRWTYLPVHFGREEEVVAATREHLARGQSAEARARAITRFFEDGPGWLRRWRLPHVAWRCASPRGWR